jgi:hypothetical protein
MPEPEGDHRHVHAGLEQMHRWAVTQYMRRHLLRPHARASRHSGGDGAAEQVVDAVTRQPRAADAGKRDAVAIVADNWLRVSEGGRIWV